MNEVSFKAFPEGQTIQFDLETNYFGSCYMMKTLRIIYAATAIKCVYAH